jgi:calcineurin-like phosphoesterase family protein
MSVFFTSDLHLFHKFVAKLRMYRAFPGIPLPSNIDHVVKWHNDILAQNWDATVGKDDVVWVIGDLALTSTKSGMASVLDWIADRPGRKHLVPGNHDPVHSMHSDSHKWQKEYLRHAFDSVQLAARRKITLSNGEHRNVLLSHMPYTGDRDYEDRDVQWRLRDEGDWLLHGHLHSHPNPLHTIGTRQIDVGVDAWNLTPVALDTLAGMIGLLEGIDDPVQVK